MRWFRSLLRKLHLRSLDRADYKSEGDRPVENLDAQASVDLGVSSGYPPGYVKDYDDGRPRH